MKVLHLCVRETNNSAAFGAGVGGYTNYTNRLMQQSESFEAKGIKNSFSAVTLPTNKKPKIIFDIFKLIDDVIRLIRGLVRFRPDVVHIHAMYWRSTYREIMFFFIGRLFGVKIFYEARGGSFMECVESNGSQGYFANILLKGSTAVSVQGKSDFIKIKEMVGKRAYFAPNVISPALEVMRDKNIDITNKVYDFVFLGYVSRAKNLDLFFKVAESLPDKKFVCIGAIEKDLIKSVVVPENVELMGRMLNVDAFKILQRSLIFFFPSVMRSEGQPNALLEAIWAGCVPVAFDHGFITDLIDDRNLLLDKTVQDVGIISAKLLDIHRKTVEEGYIASEEFFSRTRSQSEVVRLASIYMNILDYTVKEGKDGSQ